MFIPVFRQRSGTCTSYVNDAKGNVPCLQPADYHSENSNFVFLDGHVKAMRPSTTWTGETAAYVEANPPHVSGAAPASAGAGINGVDWYTYKRGMGAGSKDLWNPQISGIQFP